MKKMISATAILVALSSQPGLAKMPSLSDLPSVNQICDHRPSHHLGVTGSMALAAGTGAVAGAAGTGFVAKLYTFRHATSNLIMLGSTAGGASGAGTAGMMGGTAGNGAAILSRALNPTYWGPAVIIAAGAIAFEGGCHFFDD